MSDKLDFFQFKLTSHKTIIKNTFGIIGIIFSIFSRPLHLNSYQNIFLGKIPSAPTLLSLNNSNNIITLRMCQISRLIDCRSLLSIRFE